MSTDDTKHFGALSEKIRDQNKALLEGMKDLPTHGEFKEQRYDVTDLKTGCEDY